MVAEAQLISMSRAITFDQDIGFASQLQQDCSAVRLFDVERNAAFVSGEVKEVKTFLRMRRIIFEWRNPARFVAARRLDFYHARAHVGEEFAAAKPQRARQVSELRTG